VFFEQSNKLLLKRHLAMVLLLGLDVLDGPVQKRHADSEGAVFDLPAKESVFRERVMHPLGGAAFDELQALAMERVEGKDSKKWT
jgi:hypothetical protein